MQSVGILKREVTNDHVWLWISSVDHGINESLKHVTTVTSILLELDSVSLLIQAPYL